MTVRLVLLSTLFAILAIPLLHARTILVPGEEQTIQDGIEASQNGDTVLVATGTYVENIRFQGKSIRLMSEDGPEQTIIDGGNPTDPSMGSVVSFRFGEDRDAVLDGFSIVNGTGTDIGFIRYGGGIFCDNGASPTIVNNVIENNTAVGGIYATAYGGGILCNDESSPLIVGNVIRNNSSYDFGGGIHCFYGSSPLIFHNTITGNSASAGGGGICCFTNTSTIISNNVIEDNSTSGDGGGVFIYYSSSSLLFNNLIVRNSARDGAGVYCYYNSLSSISNTTLVDNIASRNGGGICVVGNSVSDVRNTLLWGNEALDGPELWVGDTFLPSELTIAYSDVQGGQLSAYMEKGSTLDWGTGMIDASPLFVSYRGFEFLLRGGSPAIDAGDPAIEDSIDWPDGYPNGTRSDIGAYGGPKGSGWLR